MSQVFTSRVSGDAFQCCSFTENVGFEFVVFDSSGVVHVHDLEEWVDVLSFDRDLKLRDEICHFVDCEVAALIQIEVIEDLLQEAWFAAGKFKHATLDFAEEMGNCLLGDLGVLLLRNLPGGLHHADEIFIGRRAHAEVGVVVCELLYGHVSVLVAFGALEVAEEVCEDLVTCLTSLQELWVHGHIIDASNVLDSDCTLAVLVQHFECLFDHRHASWS